MLSGFITHPDCLRHEMGPSHPEAPVRLHAIYDHLLAKGLLDYMHAFDAPLATEEQLARAHTALYVREILSAAPLDGYRPVDPDTRMNPHTVRAALRAAGACVLATDLVLAGEITNAFCCVRPPGHHAERERAMGFCFFNNAAVGIRHALDVHGVERVALIDFDVHHGNGSEDIFRDDGRVLMCSVFERGLYPFCGEDERRPNMVNVALPTRTASEALRAAVLEHWLPALDRFEPQLIFVSAGFDAHRDDDMGNLGWVDRDYEWLTQQLLAVARRHCGGKLISTLEGGYEPNALARSVAAHVRVLVGAD